MSEDGLAGEEAGDDFQLGDTSLSAFRAHLDRFSHPKPASRQPSLPEAGRTKRSRSPSGDSAPHYKPRLDPCRSNSTTPSPSRPKRAPKPKLGYAPPETYVHLDPLQDNIKPNLDILFCGINPGIMSATKGHHFAHPTNQFWRALHGSGLTERLLDPSEDHTMPERYNYGLTNMVDRPSMSATELTKAEEVAGVPNFLAKVSKFKPRIVCFIGREISDAFTTAIRQHLRKSGIKRTISSSMNVFKSDQKDTTKVETPDPEKPSHPATYISPLATTTPGFRMLPYKMVHKDTSSSEIPGANAVVRETLFFAAPSTSGRVTHYRLEDRVQLFRVLRQEKDDVLEGRRDTQDFNVVPPSLYDYANLSA